VLDVRFELLPDYPREWKAATRVRFHLGASEIIGRLVLLEGTTLAAGGSALAQVLLEKPAVAARGDRFVVRAYSPSRTVGGGTVIEPVASPEASIVATTNVSCVTPRPIARGTIRTRVWRAAGSDRSTVGS